MCYFGCRMVQIKYPMLLIEQSSTLCLAAVGFFFFSLSLSLSLSLSEWSSTICPTPYNRT